MASSDDETGAEFVAPNPKVHGFPVNPVRDATVNLENPEFSLSTFDEYMGMKLLVEREAAMLTYKQQELFEEFGRGKSLLPNDPRSCTPRWDSKWLALRCRGEILRKRLQRLEYLYGRMLVESEDDPLRREQNRESMREYYASRSSDRQDEALDGDTVSREVGESLMQDSDIEGKG